MPPETRERGGNGGTDAHPAVQEFNATIDRVRADETCHCDGYDFTAHVDTMKGLRVRLEEIVAQRAARRRRRRRATAGPGP